MSEITQLQPKLLWQWFEYVVRFTSLISCEEKLAEFVEWAKTKTIFCTT